MTIEDILKAYKDHGFDANQDFPGNVRWEELYTALPKGTKVILTVRDNEEVWFRKRIHFKHSFLVLSLFNGRKIKPNHNITKFQDTVKMVGE